MGHGLECGVKNVKPRGLGAGLRVCANHIGRIFPSLPAPLSIGRSSTYVQTSDMEILSHQLPRLEVLDLTYCMRITVHVLEHLTNLKELHTGTC